MNHHHGGGEMDEMGMDAKKAELEKLWKKLSPYLSDNRILRFIIKNVEYFRERAANLLLTQDPHCRDYIHIMIYVPTLRTAMWEKIRSSQPSCRDLGYLMEKVASKLLREKMTAMIEEIADMILAGNWEPEDLFPIIKYLPKRRIKVWGLFLERKDCWWTYFHERFGASLAKFIIYLDDTDDRSLIFWRDVVWSAFIKNDSSDVKDFLPIIQHAPQQRTRAWHALLGIYQDWFYDHHGEYLIRQIYSMEELREEKKIWEEAARVFLDSLQKKHRRGETINETVALALDYIIDSVSKPPLQKQARYFLKLCQQAEREKDKENQQEERAEKRANKRVVNIIKQMVSLGRSVDTTRRG